jgi:serine/threonine protein kinase
MEKCKCDVYTALSKTESEEYKSVPLSIYERFFMFFNIVAGIEILNFFQIIHSDLNLHNIFIIPNKRFHVKIGDLGCAI